MGAFNSHVGPVGRIIAACSPESSVGVIQNRRLCMEMGPVFDAYLFNLLTPDNYHQELARDLTSPFVIESGGVDSQCFGALWLNRHADGGTVLRISGFQENNTQVDCLIRAYCLAIANPDNQILIVDTPSHGLSDDYTAKQRSVMFSTGDLTDTALPFTQSIATFFTDHELPQPYTGSAMSYGSRMLLEVAKHGKEQGLVFENLVNYDLPGTVPARLRTHTSYFLYEWIQDRMRFSTDWLEMFKKNFECYIDTYGDPERLRDLPNFMSRDKRAVFLNFWNSVLGMPTGLDTLLEVIESGTDTVRVNGDSSRIATASDAIRQHKFGGQTLYLLNHIPHGGIGHLVTTPAITTLDHRLRTQPQDRGVHELSLFDFIPT